MLQTLINSPNGKLNQCLPTCSTNLYSTPYVYTGVEPGMPGVTFSDQGNKCSACTGLCAKCSGSATFCTSCVSGHDMFDQAQGICKVNCLQGEAWLLSNKCIQCEIGCDSCENISAACKQEYEFMISESKDPDINYHYTFEFSIALSTSTRPVVFLSSKDFLNRKLRADSLELNVEDQTSRKQGPMTFAILDRGDKFAIAANITGFGTSWLAPESSVDYKFTLKTRDSQTPLNVTENYEINPYGGSQTERATNTEKIFVYKKGFST